MIFSTQFCTVAAVAAIWPEEHVNNALQNPGFKVNLLCNRMGIVIKKVIMCMCKVTLVVR